MKLSKAIIVSGILFSSVLGSVNVNSITAMAADIDSVPTVQYAEDTNKVQIQVNFINRDNNKDVIPSKKMSIGSDNKITILDKDVPEGYRLALNPKAETVKNNTINVQVVKTKSIQVNYIIDGKPADKNLDLNKTVNPDFNAEEVLIFQLRIDPSKYSFVNNETSFKINDNAINVALKSKGAAVDENHVNTEKPKPNNQKPTHTSKPARYVVQRVRITYVNKATNEEVGYLQLIGKDSFSKKTEAPKGYVFLNEKDATVKFDKKGNKDIKVYVKQMTSAPIKQEGTVTTSNGQYKRLFNLDGKVVKNRALSAGTSWHTDQYAVVNGEKMYRVATTEWVKAADVL